MISYITADKHLTHTPKKTFLDYSKNGLSMSKMAPAAFQMVSTPYVRNEADVLLLIGNVVSDSSFINLYIAWRSVTKIGTQGLAAWPYSLCHKPVSCTLMSVTLHYQCPNPSIIVQLHDQGASIVIHVSCTFKSSMTAKIFFLAVRPEQCQPQ